MNLEETLKNETREQIIDKLREDEHYYGEYGRQFLSNSNVGQLIKDPKTFNTPSEPNINFLLGGAFHTMVLEPEKMVNYPVSEASTRSTKAYKEEAKGDMLLLRKDMTNLEAMQKKLNGNELIHGIVQEGETEYEVPGYGEILGEVWKGKADIINHTDKMIIDLKTTSDLNGFSTAASRYNYDSQAYIYKQLFGYDFAFVVIDKKTHQLGFFDCSEAFYESGREKVIEAVYAYRLYHKGKDVGEYDWDNYLATKTL